MGRQVMALEWITSHSSYFVAYEHLNFYFDFKNEVFDL